MVLKAGDISILRRGDRLSIDYAGKELVEDVGMGLPINGNWMWTFDRSLKPVHDSEGEGRDRLGKYRYLARSFAGRGLSGEDVPLLRQELRVYDPSEGPGRILLETRVLEDIRGTYVEDSFFNTTLNSPVLLLQEDLNFLAYTWGLMGAERSCDGGHFPEAITGNGVSSIPSRLLLAGYSPTEDLNTSSDKPFAPLVLYDDDGITLVVSPLNLFLISPLRMVRTPSGMGVARGIHGSVDTLPRGTTTLTALVFGQGVAETMMRWGDWLLEAGGKERALPQDSPLLEGIGYWNCFGGYYTELFRQVDEGVLTDLAAYFHKERIPIRYFGLDLWYDYGQVGFAKNYSPDAQKYPRGLQSVYRETGLPYLLHMSAFESPNDYIGTYEFAVDRGASYPMGRKFYEDQAGIFKRWGAYGVWPDFLRTNLQNAMSLRNRMGAADRWFDDLCGAFGEQDMSMMMCMPTIGHYLASTSHQNVIAVRTHTDYLNHQVNQMEALRVKGQSRFSLSLQRSIRQNVLLSFLAHALGLRPSYDVFLTNADHPEGYAEPNAEYEALLRAMSAGVIAVGDKVGHIDRRVVEKLCFPDGRTSGPDHPPHPVIRTLQSDVLAFYTTTTVGETSWIYLAAFNVGDVTAHYELDAHDLCDSGEIAVYDYFARRVLGTTMVEGDLEPAQGHYYVIVPSVEGLHFLGFPEKYITVSNRQVSSVGSGGGVVTVNFRLPPSSRVGRPAAEGSYTVAAYLPPEFGGPGGLDVEASGAKVRRVYAEGDMVYVEFVTSSDEPSLRLRPIHR